MRWISPPTKLEVAKLRLESASMLRSMRRFSSSYNAMTMSMATKAEGTATMDINAVRWLCVGVSRKIERPITSEWPSRQKK